MQGNKVFPRYTLTENDMNKREKKEQFLELRIGGETFVRIASKLDFSNQTLINWS